MKGGSVFDCKSTWHKQVLTVKKKFCEHSQAMPYRPVALFLLSLKSYKRCKDFRLILKFWLKIHSDFRLQCEYQGALSLPSGGIGEQHSKLYPTRLSPRTWLSIPGRGWLLFLPHPSPHATKIPRTHKTLFSISGAKKALFIIIKYGLKKQYKWWLYLIPNHLLATHMSSSY